MKVKRKNAKSIEFLLMDGITREPLTNLATAINIKLVINTPTPIVKELGVMTINSPELGYVQVPFTTSDWTVDVGRYEVGIRIYYPGDKSYEPDLVFNNVATNEIEVTQNIVE